MFAWLYAAVLFFSQTACSQSPKTAAPQQTPSFANVTATMTQHSRNALAQLKARDREFGINTKGFEFLLLSESDDQLGQVHHRWQTAIDNTPVWSYTLTTHLDACGILFRVDGRLPQRVNRTDAQSEITAEKASELAAKAIGSGANDWQATQVQRVYYPVADDRLQLAYQLTMQKGLERKFVFVSAATGEVLHVASGSPR